MKTLERSLDVLCAIGAGKSLLAKLLYLIWWQAEAKRLRITVHYA